MLLLWAVLLDTQDILRERQGLCAGICIGFDAQCGSSLFLVSRRKSIGEGRALAYLLEDLGEVIANEAGHGATKRPDGLSMRARGSRAWLDGNGNAFCRLTAADDLRGEARAERHGARERDAGQALEEARLAGGLRSSGNDLQSCEPGVVLKVRKRALLPVGAGWWLRHQVPGVCQPCRAGLGFRGWRYRRGWDPSFLVYQTCWRSVESKEDVLRTRWELQNSVQKLLRRRGKKEGSCKHQR